MPTHRTWSRKSNKQIKSLFRNFLNQGESSVPQSHIDRINAEYEDQLRESRIRRQLNGEQHRRTCFEVGPPRTCEEPPRVAAAKATKEITREILIKEGLTEEQYTVRHELQCMRFGPPRVCTEKTLLTDLPSSKPEPTDLDTPISDTESFDIEVLWPALI